MSQDDPNLKRMGLFLVLAIYVFSINVCQAVILNIDSDYNEFMEYGEDITDAERLYSSSSVSFDIWGFTGSFFGYFFGGFAITLATVGFPDYMVLIMLPIYIFTTLAFWLMLIDFIKDIEILGSSV